MIRFVRSGLQLIEGIYSRRTERLRADLLVFGGTEGLEINPRYRSGKRREEGKLDIKLLLVAENEKGARVKGRVEIGWRDSRGSRGKRKQ